MNLLVDARRPLLVGILDYRVGGDVTAESLKTAISTYRRAITGPYGWTVGRFLCLTSQLETLVGVLTTSMKVGDRPWHIGAIVDEPLGAAAMHASVFHTYMNPAGTVTSLEAMANNESGISGLVAAAGAVSPSTVAVVRMESLAAERIEQAGEVARLRIQPIAVALDDDLLGVDRGVLAGSIAACVRLQVPILLGSRTDFQQLLRITTAAALANRDAGCAEIVATLEEEDPEAFTVTAVGLRWRDELFSVPSIQRARATIRSWSHNDLEAATSELEARGFLYS